MAVSFSGLPQSVVSWSVDEDATSLDRSDSPSGVPQITVDGVGRVDGVLGLQDSVMSVDSTEYGRSRMTVQDVSVTDGSWSVSAGSPLHDLVQVGVVKSGSGLRADQAVARFFAAVGVSQSAYKFRAEGLSSRTFEVPYWNDIVWAGMRQWLSANELDLNYVEDTLVLSPVGSREIYLQDISSGYSMKSESGSLARTVEVNVYHRTPFELGLVFPGRDTLYPDANEHFSDSSYSAMSVNAGEVSETTFQLSAEVESIKQPRMVSSIPVLNNKPYIPMFNYPNGIYMVVGKDNKRITPEQWYAMGGGLTVTLNDDHRSVTVRLSGMNYEELSPYRVAESDGVNDYCGLFLVGENGQYVDIETVYFDTGVGDRSRDIVNIDNTSITSLDMAYRAAQEAADRSTGHTLSLDWNGPDPVRPASEQSFGKVPGSRFLLGSHWWRAESCSFSENGVDINASCATKLSDISSRYNRVRDLQVSGRTLKSIGSSGVM